MTPTLVSRCGTLHMRNWTFFSLLRFIQHYTFQLIWNKFYIHSVLRCFILYRCYFLINCLHLLQLSRVSFSLWDIKSSCRQNNLHKLLHLRILVIFTALHFEYKKYFWNWQIYRKKRDSCWWSINFHTLEIYSADWRHLIFLHVKDICVSHTSL
jgi:hypothetical protein